jgi:hypothetical protein
MGDSVDQWLSPEVVFQHLTLGHRYNPIIIEAQPSTFSGGLNEDEVMPSVHISGVDKDTMKLVIVGF